MGRNKNMLHARHHHPPHIFQDNTIYFLTAKTIDSKLHFDTDAKKNIIRLCLKAGLQRFGLDLYAWVVLSNHYHLLLKINQGDSLFKFINLINGRSSFELNKLENYPGRKIWFNYWDKCIRNEKDFWKHFNYIHHNPVKHGYIKEQDLVKNYQFCSYRQWLKKKGDEWLTSCFWAYPIIDFTYKEDEF